LKLGTDQNDYILILCSVVIQIRKKLGRGKKKVGAERKRRLRTRRRRIGAGKKIRMLG
jgi:hypothetical protein